MSAEWRCGSRRPFLIWSGFRGFCRYCGAAWLALTFVFSLTGDPTPGAALPSPIEGTLSDARPPAQLRGGAERRSQPYPALIKVMALDLLGINGNGAAE